MTDEPIHIPKTDPIPEPAREPVPVEPEPEKEPVPA